MKTYTYIKLLPSTSLDVAHIYEHLFIDSFYKYASAELKIDPAVIGAVSGQTYNGIVFIDAWLYDRRVVKLFEQYVENEVLDMSLLKTVADQTAAEDSRTMKVTESLNQIISELKNTKWQYIDAVEPTLYADTVIDDKKLDDQNSSIRYKSVLVTLYIPLAKLTLEDRVVFHRLSVMVHDIVAAFVRQNGWYVLDNTIVKEKGGYISRGLSINLPQSAIKNSELESKLEDKIHTFNTEVNYSYIHSHLVEYAKQQLWTSDVANRLKYTDIIFSNKSVPKLATQKRVDALLDLIEVRVETIARNVAENLE